MNPPMPRSTAALLNELGPLLYGPEWHGALARDLGASLRAVQRWAAGTAEPRDPDGLRRELVALARRRGGALVEWAERNGGEE